MLAPIARITVQVFHFKMHTITQTSQTAPPIRSTCVWVIWVVACLEKSGAATFSDGGFYPILQRGCKIGELIWPPSNEIILAIVEVNCLQSIMSHRPYNWSIQSHRITGFKINY